MHACSSKLGTAWHVPACFARRNAERSIRQRMHTSAYVSAYCMCLRASSAATQDSNCSCALSLALGGRKRTCRQHTSAYVSAAYVSIRQRMQLALGGRKRTATNVRAVAAMPRLSASNDGPLFAGEKVLRGEGLLSEGEPTSACRHFCFGLGSSRAAAAAEVERTCF